MRILIVEDEAAAVKRLTKLLTALAPDLEVVGNTASVEDTVKWFAGHPAPDLAFFDVRLSDGDSFTVFDRV